jgi:hypothetical protein
MTTSINRHIQYTDPIARSLCDIVYGYGYAENAGIANRQQRALDLCRRGHYTPEDFTLNSDGCPVVTRLKVRSGSDTTTSYMVTRIPNQQEYTCNCPDTWHPCKHSYGAALLQQGFTLAHVHCLNMPAYTDIIHRLQQTHPFGSHERAALEVLANGTVAFHLIHTLAAQQCYGASRSYRAICFSALVTKARWHYGAGYSGIMVDHDGEISSVLAGRPTLRVHWHPLEVRWYIVGADDAEDTATTQEVLSATLPDWAARWYVTPDGSTPATFEVEDMEMHYALL